MARRENTPNWGYNVVMPKGMRSKSAKKTAAARKERGMTRASSRAAGRTAAAKTRKGPKAATGLGKAMKAEQQRNKKRGNRPI